METLRDVLPDFDELLKGKELDELKVVIEGKTKVVKEIEGCEGYVLVHNKDQITAHNAAKKDELEGKGVLSNLTNCRVFQFLESIGLKTHFVRQYNEIDFIAERCAMIPLEWVTRRLATGSFLKRNPGVSEGFRFSPPKLGIHFKDDAAGDPLWSEEQALEAKLVTSGIEIGAGQLQLMSRVTLLVFEVLERLWQELGVTLVDMKVEFGINRSGDIVLADVIDNDSWRLWPGGKKADMVDKQIYRDMDVVTVEKLKEMKHKFEWVQTTTQNFIDRKVNGRVVVLMGSPSDEGHTNKIQACLVEKFGIPTVIRLTSAHKNPRGTMSIIDDVQADGIPTVFIAVAGLSNGLGPVSAGYTAYPVINCPPLDLKDATSTMDLWSSVRLPSGIGCATVIGAENAGWAAATILGTTDVTVWGRIKVRQLINYINLMKNDRRLTDANRKAKEQLRQSFCKRKLTTVTWRA